MNRAHRQSLLFTIALILLLVVGANGQALCNTSLSMNYNRTSGGWWSNGIQKQAFLVNSGANPLQLCSIEFWMRARYTTETLSVTIFDANGPWAASPKVLAVGKVAVSTIMGDCKGFFDPSPLIPPNTNFYVQFDKATRVMFPVASSGTSVPYRYYLFNMWNYGTPQLPWCYQIGSGRAFKAEAKTFGCGCGTTNLLTLSFKNQPLINTNKFSYKLKNAPPNTPGVLFVGCSDKNSGGLALPFAIPFAPKCFLYSSSDLIIGITTTTTGLATQKVRIPQNNLLLGQTIYSQYLCIDTKANALGLISSNGGASKIGDFTD